MAVTITICPGALPVEQLGIPDFEALRNGVDSGHGRWSPGNPHALRDGRSLHEAGVLRVRAFE